MIKLIVYAHPIVFRAVYTALSKPLGRRAPVRHDAISHLMALKDDDEIDGYVDLLEAYDGKFGKRTLAEVGMKTRTRIHLRLSLAAQQEARHRLRHQGAQKQQHAGCVSEEGEAR